MIRDLVASLITHLKGVSEISTLVGTRVFGGELPGTEVESMPRKSIVLRLAGGPEEIRTHPLGRGRVDVFSYGEDPLEAGRVDRAVAQALFDVRRTSADSTLLHSAGYGGAFHLKDPETGWPVVLRTTLVLHGETVLA